jgi:hypothetical protein
MNSPIFIGGLERSGKTYMRMILAAHPHLVFSHRANMWTSYYNRYGDLNQGDNLKRCMAEMLESKHIRSLISDPTRLNRDIGTAPVSYSSLFTLIHEQHALKMGKLRWGDQTEFIERYTDAIFAVYPNARIIHMLRDPRDRFEAMQHKSHRRGGLGVATARWKISATLAQRNQSKYPEQYKVVCYETLVTSPNSTLFETCEFIGEEFFIEMLRMQEETRFNKNESDDTEESSGPLTTKYIGCYHNKLRASEIAYIQKQVGVLMSAFGYTVTPIRLSWKERLRFHLLDEAVNSFYKLSWHINDRIKNSSVWNTDRSLLVD